jgi:hypothetical protein
LRALNGWTLPIFPPFNRDAVGLGLKQVVLVGKGPTASRLKGGTNMGSVQPFNARKAVEYARTHLGTDHCARHVRQAIQAGGITLARTESAKDYGPILQAAGFVPALNQSDDFQDGDVVVIQGFLIPALTDRVDPDAPRYCSSAWNPPRLAVIPHESVHGHMAIYDKEKNQWISYFKQQPHAFPGSPGEWYDHARPQYKVYRHPTVWTGPDDAVEAANLA